MEIIAVILMIVFALVSAGDRKRKAANRTGAAQPTTKPQGRPVSQMSLVEREARLNQLRQKREARQATKAEAAEPLTPVMPSSAQAVFDSSLTELKELLDVAQAPSAEGESMLADADCAGGSMPHSHGEGASILEDEECAGGSLPHSHTQGESREARRRRYSEADREGEAEGLVPGAIDARALRRAVVMAEVLGKPKGLKRSRFVA